MKKTIIIVVVFVIIFCCCSGLFGYVMLKSSYDWSAEVLSSPSSHPADQVKTARDYRANMEGFFNLLGLTFPK